ncbi:hypothetical protein ACHAXS_011726 [Conticribra weissflogii]
MMFEENCLFEKKSLFGYKSLFQIFFEEGEDLKNMNSVNYAELVPELYTWYEMSNQSMFQNIRSMHAGRYYFSKFINIEIRFPDEGIQLQHSTQDSPDDLHWKVIVPVGSFSNHTPRNRTRLVASGYELLRENADNERPNHRDLQDSDEKCFGFKPSRFVFIKIEETQMFQEEERQ